MTEDDFIKILLHTFFTRLRVEKEIEEIELLNKLQGVGNG